jgi:hypothetical protein
VAASARDEAARSLGVRDAAGPSLVGGQDDDVPARQSGLDPDAKVRGGDRAMAKKKGGKKKAAKKGGSKKKK